MHSAADLAYMRDTQNLTLTDRAILEHRSCGVDGMGGTVTVLTYTGNIPCRVAPMRVQVQRRRWWAGSCKDNCRGR